MGCRNEDRRDLHLLVQRNRANSENVMASGSASSDLPMAGRCSKHCDPCWVIRQSGHRM